ncbi:MAG: DUF3575 domain-containing protein [Muribaculaceae bacterium]|nr:DUF3575 domain-containing protein [Muribaculaceae bacterium]
MTRQLGNIKIKLIIAFLLLAGASSGAYAQNVALKSNLLYDAIATPDLGVEVKLAPQWTLEMTGNVNFWKVNDRRWKQWNVQPEARFWFCQAFSGHFLGAHLIGGQYNFGNLPFNFKFLGSDFSKLRDSRYQGWMGGAGLAYGYSWILDRHWNFEAEIGVGWIYATYDKYPCAVCGTKLDSGHHNYFGPTKAALNIVYVF